MATLSELPTDLPDPVDDGACNHLEGVGLPDLSLASTKGGEINLSSWSSMLFPMWLC